MRMPVRQRPAAGRPGVVGTARVDRRTRALLPRLHAGDVAVLDHADLDRTTAQALVDAGVVAVVNAAPMVSGRYPSLGPEVLVAAGVSVVDRVGSAGLVAITDGVVVRVDGGTGLGEDGRGAAGRRVDAEMLACELTAAREGLTAHLETFTHNTTEFLRREQDLLLHDLGVPRPATRVAGRPAVVVSAGHDHTRELALVRTFVREQHPVLVGVGRGADALRAVGLRADVVVLDASADDSEIPSAKVLKAARDVVVRTDRGAGRSRIEHLERLGVRPLRFESGATPEDAALLLVAAADAALIVGVGLRATLEELLDSRRAGLASTYLTRLKVGQRIVGATAVPYLYAGRVRPRHLLLVMRAGLSALGAAVGVTPVGQEWADALAHTLRGLLP